MDSLRFFLTGFPLETSSEGFIFLLSCAACGYIVFFELIRFRWENLKSSSLESSPVGSSLVFIRELVAAFSSGSVIVLVYQGLLTPLSLLGCFWGLVLWRCVRDNVGRNPPLPGNQKGVSWGYIYVRSLDFVASGLRIALYVQVLSFACGLVRLIPESLGWQVSLASVLLLAVIGLQRGVFWGILAGSIVIVGFVLQQDLAGFFEFKSSFFHESLHNSHPQRILDSGPWVGMLFLWILGDNLTLSSWGRAYTNRVDTHHEKLRKDQSATHLGDSINLSWIAYGGVWGGIVILAATKKIQNEDLNLVWQVMVATVMGTLLVGRKARVKRFVRSLTVLEKVWGFDDPSVLHKGGKIFLWGMAFCGIVGASLASTGWLWDAYACVYSASVLAPWYEKVTSTHVASAYRFRALVLGVSTSILGKSLGVSLPAFVMLCCGYSGVLIYGSLRQHTTLRWVLRGTSHPPDLVRRWVKIIKLGVKPYTRQYITRLRDYGLPMGMWMALQNGGGAVITLLSPQVFHGWAFAQLLGCLCAMGMILSGRLWLDKWPVKAAAYVWNTLLFFGFFILSTWGVRVNQGSALEPLWIFFSITNGLLVGALESWLKAGVMSLLGGLMVVYGPWPFGYGIVGGMMAASAGLNALGMVFFGSRSSPEDLSGIGKSEALDQPDVILQRVRDSLRLVEKQVHYVGQFQKISEKLGAQDERSTMVAYELARVERFNLHSVESLKSWISQISGGAGQGLGGILGLVEVLEKEGLKAGFSVYNLEKALGRLHRGLRYLAEQLCHTGIVLQHVSHPQQKTFDLVELLHQRLEGAHTLWGSSYIQGVRLKGPDSFMISGDVYLWSRSLDYMMEEGMALVQQHGILSIELINDKTHLDIRMMLSEGGEVNMGGEKNALITEGGQKLSFLLTWMLRHQNVSVYIQENAHQKVFGLSVRV